MRLPKLRRSDAPGPAIRYEVEVLPGGDRLVRSVGLEPIGQAEVGARVSAARDHETDHHVMGVLDFIAKYVISSQARITAQQTMEYGWTMLKFFDHRPAMLEIYEHSDPLGGEAEAEWIAGLALALALQRAQDDAMRRNRLTGTAEHPNRGHSAVICSHLFELAGQHALRMDRTVSLGKRHSGWSLVCTDQQAHHSSAATLQSHHLAHVALRFPFIVPYTCMPVGSMVVFDGAGAIVWGVGAERGARDPADPYSWTLQTEK